jgi:uncharacterized membrane protein YbhN (UPF0104 family)
LKDTRVDSRASVMSAPYDSWPRKAISIVRDHRVFISKLGGTLIVLVIFGLMGRTMYLGWQEVVAYQWNLDYRALLVAFALMLSSTALYAYLWKSVLERLGGTLNYRKSYRIYYLSQLGRYIPGKIWSVLGLVYLSDREGVSKATSAASVILQLALQILSGVIVFAVTLPFWRNAGVGTGLYGLIVLLPVGLVLVHPGILGRGLRLALRTTGQPAMEISWGYGYLVGQLGLWAVFWLMNGVAHYFLIGSIYPSSLPPLLVLVGVFAISWVAGFLSLVTPSGLGVMEGTLALLLSSYFPAPVATIIALWTRLARTVVDLVCAGIAGVIG